MTTTRSTTASVIRNSLGVASDVLIFKIYRKYGKRAAGLAYAACLTHAAYVSWPYFEILLGDLKEARESQKRIDQAVKNVRTRTDLSGI